MTYHIFYSTPNNTGLVIVKTKAELKKILKKEFLEKDVYDIVRGNSLNLNKLDFAPECEKCFEYIKGECNCEVE